LRAGFTHSGIERSLKPCTQDACAPRTLQQLCKSFSISLQKFLNRLSFFSKKCRVRSSRARELQAFDLSETQAQGYPV
ncbi:MAG: hypothetical protein AB1631_23795, partial [Acidobacteriota bacterium]